MTLMKLSWLIYKFGNKGTRLVWDSIVSKILIAFKDKCIKTRIFNKVNIRFRTLSHQICIYYLFTCNLTFLVLQSVTKHGTFADQARYVLENVKMLDGFTLATA